VGKDRVFTLFGKLQNDAGIEVFTPEVQEFLKQ